MAMAYVTPSKPPALLIEIELLFHRNLNSIWPYIVSERITNLHDEIELQSIYLCMNVFRNSIQQQKLKYYFVVFSIPDMALLEIPCTVL